MDDLTHYMTACSRLVAENKSLREALKEDASDLWRVTHAIKKEIASREWIMEGRDCYSWDDDRYRDETRLAFEAVIKLIDEVRHPAQKRFRHLMRDTYPHQEPEIMEVTMDRIEQIAVINREVGSYLRVCGMLRQEPDEKKLEEYAKQIDSLYTSLEKVKQEVAEEITNNLFGIEDNLDGTPEADKVFRRMVNGYRRETESRYIKEKQMDKYRLTEEECKEIIETALAKYPVSTLHMADVVRPALLDAQIKKVFDKLSDGSGGLGDEAIAEIDRITDRPYGSHISMDALPTLRAIANAAAEVARQEIKDHLMLMNNPPGTPEYYMISVKDWQSLGKEEG